MTLTQVVEEYVTVKRSTGLRFRRVACRRRGPAPTRASVQSAGLRLGEALALTLDDVDLHTNMLLVRNTKFFKTRIGIRRSDSAYFQPAHALLCQQVLAMPSKRHQRKPIAFLDASEITAVLAAPDLSTWIGRRDRTLLAVAAHGSVAFR